jgi:steroid 5-alpha reductase family enzyme
VSLFTQVGLIWLAAALYMAVAWAIALRVRNIGYVDVFWAGGMLLAAVAAGFLGTGDEWSRALVALFGGIWGARLCLYLLHRVLNEAEDGRYVAMRAAIGDVPWKWFLFFQAQAVVIALFAIPLVAAAAGGHQHFDAHIVVALLIWLVAMGGESGQSRHHLPHRPVGLVASSKLFLRVAALVRLRGLGARWPLVGLEPAGPGDDAGLPVPLEWYPVDGGAGLAQPR